MRLIDADALPSDDFCGTPMVLQSDIDSAPTIDAEPVVHGEWEIYDGCVCCSVCGEPCMEFNYCPNCGAKMDGERKNDDKAQ